MDRLVQAMDPERNFEAANALSKLAQSDSESEEDALVRKPGGGLLSRLQHQPEENVSEDDDEEAVLERTKQRLMSRRTIHIASSDDEEEEEDGNGEDAYKRMKKRLMGVGSQQTTTADHSQAPRDTTKNTSIATSSDEDGASFRSKPIRRLQTRKQRIASPSASPPGIRSRQSSPGLFVTPESSPATRKIAQPSESLEDVSDGSTKPALKADFNERVKRIRAERLAKQIQENEKQTKIPRRSTNEESESNSDGEDGRRLTQQSKPTRKAGKKAIEAMKRDQQRIVRNMQLTHQAKTKKRYSTKDLFAKLGYNQGNEDSERAGLPSPDTSSLPTTSDAEANQTHDTPPTSPPSADDVLTKVPKTTGIAPASDKASSPTPTKLDKGKGRAPEFAHVPFNPLLEHSIAATNPGARAGPKSSTTTAMVELSDSEDDIEVVQPKSRFPVFDNLPEKRKQENPSLLHLRHLAHLTSPNKRGPKGRKSMNLVELQMSLQQKARQQAQRERKEKIDELRRKGIHVETEEEREKRQMQIEDIVAELEKAREEDLKLMKSEREEAKKNGELGDGLLSSDESEDDDYIASGEENAAEAENIDEDEEEVDIELSGSEDEEPEEEEDEEDPEVNEPNTLIDGMADEASEEEQEAESENVPSDEDPEGDEVNPLPRKRTAYRARNVIVDDEDEDGEEEPQNGSPTQSVTQANHATQDDAMAAFGFGNSAPGFGLTQAFAGTMANLEAPSQDDQAVQESEQDSFAFLRSLPDTQPTNDFSQADLLIPNSQAAASQQSFSRDDTLSQMNLGISQLVETSPAFSRTQLSEIPEPTQDAGFLLSRSPASLVPPPSTVDTVMMSIVESPVLQRKRKLHQKRRETHVELSDVDDDLVLSGSDAEPEKLPKKDGDVFNVMKKAARKQQKVDNFNKKTSWAKDVVEEQAEESEDEYAGIGGASDDESGNEADEELAKMIDENDVKVDERKIAAFFAEKSKQDDEKNINQLYKDLMSGNLRKRAGADAFELSDSEDEAEMRRRKRQREFQQMTKALVQDERIGKIAENAKKSAFFKTLIDHYDDPDYDFLNNPEEMPGQESQSQSDENKDGNEDFTVPDSQAADQNVSTVPLNTLKRKATDSQEKENRPPPHLRRTAASDSLVRKPMSLADVQHSVSELLEDPRIMVPDSQYISESEDEQVAPVHTNRKSAIVDRLTLSRTSTSSESTTTSSNMAFHAPSTGAHQPGFRVPSLIRRATSNFSNVSERSSGSNTPVEGGVRRGGTGRSNIHAQAREAERRAVVEKADLKRKQALKKKVGKARGARSVLKDLGGGFE